MILHLSVVRNETYANFVEPQEIFSPKTYILVESVFALSLSENVEVFLTTGQRTALISCVAMWLYTFGVCTSYYSSVGYRVVYSYIRSFHNLHLDKRKSAPHFLFCVKSHSRSCVATKKLLL